MDPVNLECFREAAMDDVEFMRELFDVFRNDTPSQLVRLRDAVSIGDFEVTAAAAHRLKGSSGNIGATSLLALAKQLERAGKSSSSERAQNLIAQVETEYGRVCEFLATTLESEPTARTGS